MGMASPSEVLLVGIHIARGRTRRGRRGEGRKGCKVKGEEKMKWKYTYLFSILCQPTNLHQKTFGDFASLVHGETEETAHVARQLNDVEFLKSPSFVDDAFKRRYHDFTLISSPKWQEAGGNAKDIPFTGI